jgi:predicted regulator of Ras-like GTPase activity (Roadblock/LC7/MglB family)
MEGAAPAPEPGTGDSIRIFLKPILLKLPDLLKGRVRQPPGGPIQISIPLEKVLAQLPHGSVRVSFGELRQASPAGVFADQSDQDQIAVELPLPEILAQLRPDQLPRRAAQKKVEVPDNVGGIFGEKGEPLNSLRMSTAPAKAAPVAVAPQPEVAPISLPAPNPAMASKPVQAPAPTMAPKPAAPSTLTLQPVAPIKPISPLPRPPIKPASPLPFPSTLKSQSVPASAAAVPAEPVPARAPHSPAAPMEPLSVPVAQLMGAWPDAIKQALADMTGATVLLPADELEQSLKRGKILFSWKQICSLIHPPPSPSAAQVPGETQLELPLSVIAPLFMAHRRPAGRQTRHALGGEIPDLFVAKGLAQPAPAHVTVPLTAPAAPTPPPAVALVRPLVAAPVPEARAIAVAPLPQEVGEVFGQPGRKNWTPSEIVQKTSALNGVAGALIAMQDGLLVAGHLPPGLNGETIAAFLPQLFSRVLQYSKELKFGEANNLTIIVDNVPLKVFKVGGVFFTVLGRADEALPEPHLGIIAAQLAPQNK